jgi:hypothetical protein
VSQKKSLLDQRPRELHQYRVVVTQNRAICLEEHVSRVRKAVGLELECRRTTVENLVNRLARSGLAGVITQQGIRSANGRDAVLDQLDPDVLHAVLGGEDAGDIVGSARVARVSVAEDDDGLVGGVRFDIVGDLAEVGGAGFEVRGGGTRVRSVGG